MPVFKSLLLLVLLSGCLYSEKPLYSKAVDTNLPETMVLAQGYLFDEEVEYSRGEGYYLAERLPNGVYGLTNNRGQMVYAAMPVQAENGFILLQIENMTAEDEAKRFTYGMLSPAPKLSDKVELHVFFQPVYLADKHKVMLEQINVQTNDSPPYALVSDQNQLEQALPMLLKNGGIDITPWRLLDMSDESDAQEAEKIVARLAPPPPPKPLKVRKPANHCLDLTRNKDTRTIYVANTCQQEIIVRICTLSKTNLALKIIGSWVADEECRYARGTKGHLTSFFFANVSDAPIWNMLSDASYRVSATFSE